MGTIGFNRALRRRMCAVSLVSAGVSVVLGGLLLAPGTATGAPLSSGCTADTTGTVTCIYTTAGSHELDIPVGVTTLKVTAIGGRGGNFGDIAGGQGAIVTATVTVTPASRALFAFVAGNGTDTKEGTGTQGGAGGLGGGGNGGSTNPSASIAWPGAGGGGASDIRTAPGDLTSRVLVAAGGGGSARQAPAGHAGEPGNSRAPVVAAQPGTATAGGAGGVVFDDRYAGSPGVLGVGGTGAPRVSEDATVAGGGGGGGLYGGGGGGSHGGGAGGSSLVPAGGTQALSDQDPSITITYQPADPSNPPVPSCSGSICILRGTFGSS